MFSILSEIWSWCKQKYGLGASGNIGLMGAERRFDGSGNMFSMDQSMIVAKYCRGGSGNVAETVIWLLAEVDVLSSWKRKHGVQAEVKTWARKWKYDLAIDGSGIAVVAEAQL